MNILFISGEYPPETGNGGIGTYTQTIATELARRNHSITVIAAGSENEEIRLQDKVTVFRVPPVPYPLPKANYAFHLRRAATILFPHTLQRLSRAIAVRNKVCDLLKRSRRFDIIEAPECGAESLLVPAGASRATVIRMHTPWEMIRSLDALKEAPGDRFALPLMERITARRAAACSSPSLALADHIAPRWRLPVPVVIPNPLPARRFPRTSGGGWIFTGRVERRKGVHHLIEAYARLFRENGNIPALTILGRAYGTDKNGVDYGTFIRNAIAASGASSSITWIDHVPHDEVETMLSRSSVAFFPSLWENYPYACLEAMSCGCAVVASHCGGFPEMIDDEKSGILVPVHSPHALYIAMKRLVEFPALSAKLGNAARDRAGEIADPERICQLMLSFYQSTLGVHR